MTDRPMRKLEIRCVNWRPFTRNTLQGFAAFNVPAMRLTIRDCAVHRKNGRRWVQLPARPILDDNRDLVHDVRGKIQYATIVQFDSREVSDAFSAAALHALDASYGGSQ